MVILLSQLVCSINFCLDFNHNPCAPYVLILIDIIFLGSKQVFQSVTLFCLFAVFCVLVGVGCYVF